MSKEETPQIPESEVPATPAAPKGIVTKLKSLIHKSRWSLLRVLAVLPICTLLVASGLYWIAAARTDKPQAAHIVAKSTTNPDKQRQKIATTTVYELGTGSYEAPETAKSRVLHDTPGRLLMVTSPDGATNYLIAVSSGMPKESQAPASGWKVAEIDTDSMWEPATCAQNPSYIVDERYIVINDGSYINGQTVNYYTVFDMQAKTFRYFEEKKQNDLSSRDNIIGMNVEDGKLVMYIDYRDQSGPFMNSTSFKHRTGKDIQAIVRRVMNMNNLSYADYRVPFGKAPYEDYYLRVGVSDGVSYLSVGTDGEPVGYNAKIVPNTTLTLQKGHASIPSNPNRINIQKVATTAMPGVSNYEYFTIGQFGGAQ